MTTRAPSPTDDELREIEARDAATSTSNWTRAMEDRRILLAALRASRAERDEARNDLDLCDQRYNEEYLAVDRVWKALGITTYEEAHGKEISEHVGDLRTRAEAAERERDALREALRRHGQHLNHCDQTYPQSMRASPDNCTCGLDAALASRPPCSAEATQGKPVKEE